jgi:hypothetical protein
MLKRIWRAESVRRALVVFVARNRAGAVAIGRPPCLRELQMHGVASVGSGVRSRNMPEAVDRPPPAFVPRSRPRAWSAAMFGYSTKKPRCAPFRFAALERIVRRLCVAGLSALVLPRRAGTGAASDVHAEDARDVQENQGTVWHAVIPSPRPICSALSNARAEVVRALSDTRHRRSAR